MQSQRRFILLPRTGEIAPCTEDQYWNWHKKLSPNVRSALGQKLWRAEGVDYVVSTAFLGVAVGFSGSQPLVFETMVVGGKYNTWTRRYTNYKDATEGHAAVVKKVQSASAVPFILKEA